MSQASLFDAADTGNIPLTRTPDHASAEIAASKVVKTISQLQQSILSHIAIMQPVTALELEELDIFAQLAPSTVRKRISELAGRGKIIGGAVQSYRSRRTGRTSQAIGWSVMEGASL
jgi:chromosome segregation and condensation protein ScpB